MQDGTSIGGRRLLTYNKENTASKLMWRGSLPFVFTGDHAFEFQPSKVTPGSTTLLQYEDFSGLLSFMMRPASKMGTDNLNSFGAFNDDIKKEAEKGGS